MAGLPQAGQRTEAITLGQVVRAALWPGRPSPRRPAHHWKVLRAIAACRTPALGGHLYQCAHCGREHFVPHSCRNRHCPTCQGLNGAQWLEKQAADLLPIPYFHVVFTLPHELNGLVQYNQRLGYDLLFASATETLLAFGRNNLQAQLGITAVLHTWGQKLDAHYHLHCIVTGGGLSLDGSRWVPIGPRWLFPVRALSVVFRAKFRDGLNRLFECQQLQWPPDLTHCQKPAAFGRWLRPSLRRKWVVYAKRPFAGPKTVLAYLCRYTHRVGLTNRRLQALNRATGTVSFDYKDYADGARHKSLTLSLEEFLRRFCLHILPPRFVKLRHYGLLSNRDRPTRLARVRQLLAALPPQTQPLNTRMTPPSTSIAAPPLVCPHCGARALVLLRVLLPLRTARPPISDTS